MSNLSFQKITFPRMKPILSSTCMRLKLHTATQSENHYFYFDGRIIENHWFYTLISLSNGLWKVHVCNMAQTEPQNGISKTSIKPMQYCSFTSRSVKMSFSRFYSFWHIYQTSPNGPRGLSGSARRPPRFQECMWNQWKNKYYAKMVRRRCQIRPGINASLNRYPF